MEKKLTVKWKKTRENNKEKMYRRRRKRNVKMKGEEEKRGI